MSDLSQNGVLHAQLSFAQRAWRALGFSYHMGDDPPGADELPGSR
jgi:hypothetical protein